MKKKTIIKIIISLGAAVLIGITVLLIIKIRKPDELKLGMSQEMVEFIVHKNRYNYGVAIPDHLYGIHDAFYINKVKGYCELYFDNHKLNRIIFIVYSFDIEGDTGDIDSYEEQNRKAKLLIRYLNKKYGEPIEKGTDSYGHLFMVYEKEDMNIKITYPEEGGSVYNISVEWYYKKI